ncbi:hypothetical protein [Burkholderia vietnamiensis]|uniref:hypothetical protein n=1 Tax=Burkholderia vietnamiensis TaxID=60552 RepID=UPI001B9722FE|nr:hypothetical protein [Burkholderia vietnamiensis]MBR8279748.1 hypothetical protein [Burkholderia vietnamiensis]
MIDQDKMRALAAELRKYTGTGCVVDDTNAAADAIDLLLAEVEATNRELELSKLRVMGSNAAVESITKLVTELRAELEATAADKRDQLARLLAIIEKDSEWADARAVDWTRGVLMATLKVALAQRQGEGS